MIINIDSLDLEGSEPLPHGLVVGHLAEGYDPADYLEVAAELRAWRKAHKKGRQAKVPEPAQNLATADHYAFVMWFEQKATPAERTAHADQFCFAMSGLGLLPHEQAAALGRLGIDTKVRKVKLQPPSSGFWPDVLPLWLAVLVQRIVEHEGLGGREWRGWVSKLCRALSLVWHSRRLDYANGKEYGIFAHDYVAKRVGIKGRGTVSKVLESLEKWSLISCVEHGGKLRNCEVGTNRFGVPSNIISKPFPLLFISTAAPPSPSKQPREPRPLAFSLVQTRSTASITDLLTLVRYSIRRRAEQNLPHGDLEFEEDAFQRRHMSAKQHSNTADHEKGVVFPDAKELMDRAKALIEAKADTIRIDHNFLNAKAALYRQQVAEAKSDRERSTIQQRLRLVEAMADEGVCSEYGMATTGRLTASPLPNPLNTSRLPQRYGSDFWAAINEPLWAIDIRSADMLFGALLAGDKALFDDCLTGDLYSAGNTPEIIRNALGLEWDDDETAAAVRKVAKGFTLATTYGAGPAALKTVAPSVGVKEIKDFQADFKGRYPVYFEWSEKKRRYGAAAYKHGWQPRLPNALLLVVRPRNGTPPGYGTPACFVQATVKVAVSAMLLELGKRGFDPVFEIHDAVVVRKPVPEAVANSILWDVIKQMAQALGRNWRFDVSKPVVKIEQITGRRNPEGVKWMNHGVPRPWTTGLRRLRPQLWAEAPARRFRCAEARRKC